MTTPTRHRATPGERIRELRIASGLKQREFATACGITQGAISQIERGNTRELSGPVLLKLCRRLRTTGEYILDGIAPGPNADSTKVLVSSAEAYLLDCYRACTEQDRAEIVRGAWLRAKDRAGQRHISDPAPPPKTPNPGPTSPQRPILKAIKLP